MDREHVKGAAGKVKGASKGTAGKVRDDKKLQGKGKSDKSKGLPENSNLHINEEDKKLWTKTVGGTWRSWLRNNTTTNTRFDWNAAPKGAAFFLRVAKDQMQWQLYEAALTLKRLLGKLMRGSTFEEDG
jgi:hypothetical protein